MSYPSGFVAKYIYNSYGYLTQIQDYSTHAAIWTANQRDAELHLKKSTDGNGKITIKGYDQYTGNLLNICTSSADPCAGDIQNQSYTPDKVGNLVARSDTYENWNETFCYDAWGRLSKYSLDGSTCTDGSDRKVMWYDGGNITRKSDVCGAVACYNYGENGAGPQQLTSISTSYNGVATPTFQYDANGNMKCMLGSGQTCTAAHAARFYSWTSFNQVASITQGSTSVGLAYGDLHQRYKMCTPDCTSPTSTTYYLYDPVTGGMSETAAPPGNM
ncbi:MAG TPA: hypothetical protein VHU18_13135 [Rhizomicrobium sp.]|nr:hypothetical protein [Rhizomicrobium sp.]